MSIGKFLLLSLIVGWSVEALADPPGHAPAHGWRKKHDPGYVGYTGHEWDRDYGIRSGRCNREEVGTVIGGVIGGAIGSGVGDGKDRAVATIIGAAVGALLGNRIGRRLDEADRGCFAHALEIGQAGESVVWENRAAGVRYEMLPGEPVRYRGDECRAFSLRAMAGEQTSAVSGTACPTDDGVWRIAGKPQELR